MTGDEADDEPVRSENGLAKVEGALDLGFTSYWDSETHGQRDTAADGDSTQTMSTYTDTNGETIGGTTDDDKGDVKTEAWPDAATDPEELNDAQRAVIRAAVMNPEAKYTEINEAAGLADDYSKAYARVTLQGHWPEFVERRGNTGTETKLPNSDIEDVRRRVIFGESASEIADEYDCSKVLVGKKVRGVSGDDSDSDIPPLEWDNTEQKYVLPDGADVNLAEGVDGQVSEDEESEGQENPTDDEADTDSEEPTPTPPRELGSDERALILATIDAIQATTLNEETENAMDHLRGVVEASGGSSVGAD